MTNPDIPKLAAGLTKGQRKLLFVLPRNLAESIRWGHEVGQRWRDSSGWQLMNAGLVDYSGRGPRGAVIIGLTPLGLAVRAHLANPEQPL